MAKVFGFEHSSVDVCKVDLRLQFVVAFSPPTI
jgi:hypothetical protein